MGVSRAKGFGVSPLYSLPVNVSQPEVNEDGWVEVLIRIRPNARWLDIESELKDKSKAIINALRRISGKTSIAEDRLLSRDLMWLARRLATGELYKEIWQDYCDKYSDDLKWSNKRRKRKKEIKYYGELAILSGGEVVQIRNGMNILVVFLYST